MSRFNWTRAAVAAAVVSAGVMGTIVASQRTASSMTKATTALLDSLTPEQKQKMALPMDSADRTRWNFVPTNMFPRQGLPLKEMTEPQRKLAHELLRTALSQRGYSITRAENGALLRDPARLASIRAAIADRKAGLYRDERVVDGLARFAVSALDAASGAIASSGWSGVTRSVSRMRLRG